MMCGVLLLLLWYGVYVVCVMCDGGLVYVLDKVVCVLDGEMGVV